MGHARRRRPRHSRLPSPARARPAAALRLLPRPHRYALPFACSARASKYISARLLTLHRLESCRHRSRSFRHARPDRAVHRRVRHALNLDSARLQRIEPLLLDRLSRRCVCSHLLARRSPSCSSSRPTLARRTHRRRPDPLGGRYYARLACAVGPLGGAELPRRAARRPLCRPPTRLARPAASTVGSE